MHLSPLGNPDITPGSLTADCQRNLPAEKELIAGCILVGNHSVKDNERFLCYTCTIIRHLNSTGIEMKV